MTLTLTFRGETTGVIADSIASRLQTSAKKDDSQRSDRSCRTRSG